MSLAGNEHQHEIIIVKHHGGDHEDGHHGGAWKIAFADFMTAMMCFFLVMWLINAANEETKVAVASYFNPVKLVDRNSAKRGLDSLGEGPQSADSSTETSETETKKPAEEGPKTAGATDAENKADPTDAKNYTDQHLFENPYAVLAEIAADTGIAQNTSSKGDGGAADAGPATGASGGEAYRDPFAPDFWSKEVESQPEQAMAEDAAPNPLADEAGQPAAGAPTPSEVASDLQTAFPAPAAEAGGVEPATLPAAAPLPEQRPTAEQVAEATEPAQDKPTERIVAEAERIGEVLRKEFGGDDKMFGGISVVPTERGVMISVTDQLNVGMFEIGSAVPRRDLVLAMEKISAVLKGEKGNIVINGHTDGRPFTSKLYDNWRLSTARAQAAYYMLARAGLDEERIVSVSGYADRKLKVKNDPFAETNRRIEILLETGS
ncbi:MAG: MotB family protein [Rhizobiaceae bacterium]|nr:MAG: MotB family protein [Rhizobiaceae bacterium]CAG0966865.1 Chemotaxis protein LafU [Rhizobiaceae bacterium]